MAIKGVYFLFTKVILNELYTKDKLNMSCRIWISKQTKKKESWSRNVIIFPYFLASVPSLNGELYYQNTVNLHVI
jgi:hypothetical protein